MNSNRFIVMTFHQFGRRLNPYACEEHLRLALLVLWEQCSAFGIPLRKRTRHLQLNLSPQPIILQHPDQQPLISFGHLTELREQQKQTVTCLFLNSKRYCLQRRKRLLKRIKRCVVLLGNTAWRCSMKMIRF